MKQLIKRILTESTMLDQVLDLLHRQYPNPIKEMNKGMEYLQELGFDNEEVMSIYKYHIKNEFPNVMGVYDYSYIFDGLFQPDTIEYYFDRGVNDDNAEEDYIIYMNYDESGYGDIPVMELRTRNYKNPILGIEDYYIDTLNSLFGSKWKNPFKIWFEERFDREVNTIIYLK